MISPSVLHFFTGFPMVIGLPHIEGYKKIKVSNHADSKSFKKPDGTQLTGYGVMHGYHHYVIATRPRCMFLKNGFYWSRETGVAVGNLEFEVGYKNYVVVPFRLCLNGASPYPFPVRDGLEKFADIANITIEESPTGYPNRLVFQTKSDKFGYFLEPDLLHFIEVDDSAIPGVLDFRVEYIGISTGEKGDRDFGDRLWNHEKVREISGEIQRNSPNLQVYAFGYQASYLIEPYPGTYIKNSNILETQLGLPKTAQVLEASLIQHFRPKFNKEYLGFMKTEFPDWLPEIKRILNAGISDDEWSISVVMPSDCRHNPEGSWKFGGFYTDHTRNRGDLTELTQINLSLHRKETLCKS